MPRLAPADHCVAIMLSSVTWCYLVTPLHKYYQDHYFYCFTHYTVTSSASPGPEVRYIMLGLGRHHATSRNIQASIYNITSLVASIHFHN